MATFREQIQVSLGLDNRPFQRGLRTAGDSARQFAGGLRNMLGSIGVTLGLSAVVRELVKMSDELLTASDKLGVSTDFLQKLGFAAQQTGVDVRSATVGFQRFTRRIAEAFQGTGELKDTLKQYGVQVADSNGKMRSAEEVFRDFADVLAGIENPAERVRVAFKAFDTEGVALIATLKDGSKGFDEFGDKLEKMGGLIQRKTLVLIDSTSKKLLAYKTAATGFFAGIVSGIVGTTENLSRWLGVISVTGRDADALANNLRALNEELDQGAKKTNAMTEAQLAQIEAMEKQKAATDNLAKAQKQFDQALAGGTGFKTVQDLANANFGPGAGGAAILARQRAKLAIRYGQLAERAIAGGNIGAQEQALRMQSIIESRLVDSGFLQPGAAGGMAKALARPRMRASDLPAANDIGVELKKAVDLLLQHKPLLEAIAENTARGTVPTFRSGNVPKGARR